MEKSKIYGISEIAESLGVRRQTVAQWYWRRQIPPPDWRIKAGPAWIDVNIESWIEKKKKGEVYRGMISENMLDTIAKDRPQLREKVNEIRKAKRERRPQLERRLAETYLVQTTQPMTMSASDINELARIIHYYH